MKILHVIISKGFAGSELYTINLINYQSRNNDTYLIKIADNIQSIERILFTSSLLVCENGYIPNSDDDYCPPNLYGESKVIGEKIVKSHPDPKFRIDLWFFFIV